MEDNVAAEWEKIAAERPHQDAYLEEFSKRLGFKVGRSNLRTALNVLGKTWPEPLRPPPKRNNRARYFHGLVVRMAIDLGYDLPEGIKTRYAIPVPKLITAPPTA